MKKLLVPFLPLAVLLLVSSATGWAGTEMEAPSYSTAPARTVYYPPYPPYASAPAAPYYAAPPPYYYGGGPGYYGYGDPGYGYYGGPGVAVYGPPLFFGFGFGHGWR